MNKILIAFFCLFIFQQLNAQREIHLDGRLEYVEQAGREFDNGEWEEGKYIIEEGLKKYTKDSDLKMLLGKYYHHNKQYQKARYELNKALEINPNNVDAKQILVNVEMESGRYSSAICFVNELLEVNPYWRGLWRKKIELYELQGNTVEANRLRKRINQIFPEDTQAREDYLYHTEMEATELRKSGKIDDAITVSKNLVNEDPDNVANYITIINDFLKAGDRYNALAYANRGLERFPNNSELINKKAGILADEKRFSELLPYLLENGMTSQYQYYLLEAAREARNNDPVTMYGKVFESSPGNEEAFNYVFNRAVADQQYEEALYILNRHRRAVGNSKNAMLKELMVHKRMGNTAKVDGLTIELFEQYPTDSDIREAYVLLKYDQAKVKMQEERYTEAIEDWQEVIEYGDEETARLATYQLYNAYMAKGDYDNAVSALNDLSLFDPTNKEYNLKRADIYFRQKNYPMALTSYENVLESSNEDEYQKYISGYSEIMQQIVKELSEEKRYKESYRYTKRWLEFDTENQDALRYAVNLAAENKKKNEMQEYAQKGNELYPTDLFFRLKLAEINGQKSENYEQIYNELHQDIQAHPYHEGLRNAFTQLTENYGYQLIREKESEKAIERIDTALVYDENNTDLKYLKGLAYESLNQYDSAFYYQQNYSPSAMEMEEYLQHMNYLKYRGFKNEITMSHLRSRFAERSAIRTVSGVGYSRFAGSNTFSGRVYYAGRETGRGLQGQIAWYRDWNEKTATDIDVGIANKYFPRFALNASLYRLLEAKNDLTLQLGVGYRKLQDTIAKPFIIYNDMFNFLVGISFEVNDFNLGIKLNNFWLNDYNQYKYLVNLTTEARYYLGTRKHYVQAMAGVGSAPDVELIDYQFYNGFSVLNTMVGVGYSRMLYKNASIGAVGTWYNYRTSDQNFRNLYNIYVQLNIRF